MSNKLDIEEIAKEYTREEFLEEAKQSQIIIPLVDYNLRKELEDHGFIPYLNAITGEA